MSDLTTEGHSLLDHFQANMLDGDKIQPGQMLSSESVFEYLAEVVKARENKAREAERKVLYRLDLDFNVVVCDCGEPYIDTDPHDIVKARIKQLEAES